MNKFAQFTSTVLNIRKHLDILEKLIEELEDEKTDAVDALFQRLQLVGTVKKTTKFKSGEVV